MQLLRAATVTRLLRLIVCVCVLVEPMLIPAHLALTEHSFGPTATAGDDAIYADGHAYGHGHAHFHWHDQFDSDRPHPAEEHLCKAELPSTAPAPVRIIAAYEPSTQGVELGLSTESRPIVHDGSTLPLRPPRLSRAAPRAPPVGTTTG